MRKCGVTSVLPLLTYIVSTAACSDGRRGQADQSPNVPAAQSLTTRPPADSTVLRAQRAELDSLKPRFWVDSDERGPLYFSPIAGPRGTRLYCSVWRDGTPRMGSVYWGARRVWHNQVVARIGEHTVQTLELLNRFPDISRHGGVADTVLEIVRFQGNSDGGVLRAIAGSGSRRISVQQRGAFRSNEFELPDVTRRAFRDCVRLSELLRSGL